MVRQIYSAGWKIQNQPWLLPSCVLLTDVKISLMVSLRMRDARLAGFLSASRGRIFSLTEKKKTRDYRKIDVRMQQGKHEEQRKVRRARDFVFSRFKYLIYLRGLPSSKYNPRSNHRRYQFRVSFGYIE